MNRIDRKGCSIAASIASLIVMLIIFGFSAREVTDSIGQSERFTRFICKLIFFRYDEMSAGERAFIVTELDFFIRKLAHFSVYLLLGALSYTSMLLSEIKIPRKWIAALAVCALYACFDEIHQYFIPGRTMRITDVLIDSMGALVGMMAVRVIIVLFSYFALIIGKHFNEKINSKD